MPREEVSKGPAFPDQKGTSRIVKMDNIIEEACGKTFFGNGPTEVIVIDGIKRFSQINKSYMEVFTVPLSILD